MRTLHPASRWVMDSMNGDTPVGDFPPLPLESVVPAEGPRSQGGHSRIGGLQQHLDALNDDVLEKSTIELKHSIDAAHARFALQVRELERRDIPRLDHQLTTTGWLKRHCNMTATEASGTIKTARAMAHMPNVTANALAGFVPPRSVQLLAQARDRHPDPFIVHEPVFGDIATYLSVKDLRQAISHWEQQVDYPHTLAEAEQQERARSLYLAQTIDGMGDIKGSLSPEQFHMVNTAIDSNVFPSLLDSSDHRSLPQRRADALGDICQFYADHNTDIVTSGGSKPHVTITVDYDVLAKRAQRLPEIDGIPVTPDTVRRITCDANIIPMVLGSDSEPLDVGRKTRTIPAAIRRAIEHKHGGCTWPGCEAPLSWCDMHHKIHWADGGNTKLDNLVPLCRRHHTATHKGQMPPPEP